MSDYKKSWSFIGSQLFLKASIKLNDCEELNPQSKSDYKLVLKHQEASIWEHSSHCHSTSNALIHSANIY